MDKSANMIFPNTGMHILSALIHLIGVSILAHIISSRWVPFRDASWPKICLMIVFIDSYLFIFVAGVLVLGAGMEHSETTCSLGIYLCIVFYATSKVFVYWFLAERVHIVWRLNPKAKRLHSKAYLACMVVLVGYLVIFALLFIGQVSLFTDTGRCKIGLKSVASIPLLAYDLFVNIFLTVLFVLPLFRTNMRNARIKRLGIRTLFSATVALATSCINILILILMRGHQLGWVCLGSCGADVIINAVVLSWVTNTMSDHAHSNSPSIHVPQHTERNVGKDDMSRPVPPAISAIPRHDDLEHGPRSPTLRAVKTFFTRTSFDSEDNHGMTSLEIHVTKELDVHQDSDYEMQDVDKKCEI